MKKPNAAWRLVRKGALAALPCKQRVGARTDELGIHPMVQASISPARGMRSLVARWSDANRGDRVGGSHSRRDWCTGVCEAHQRFGV